ncbi:hypothetical protein [Bacillus sp. B-jedd]|uniref:hypothetical protein n=1 Tax=Bacillus sp. B-jedd TaxID=1476857 RepID=UPI0005156B14|nr:hypothetical protein [Bacillus sp. B-jedd]CEG29817.1 hypothetical protein BN1002_04778 [Bacillus sp. B-jedd]
MFKKIFIVCSSIFIISSTNVLKGNAEGFEINTLGALEDKIAFFESDNTLPEEVERQFIFENTDPSVLDAYILKLSNEFQEAVNELSEEASLLNGESFEITSETESNGLVTLTVSKDLESPVITKEFPISTGDMVTLASTPTSKQLTQSFGDKVYKIDYAFYHLLYPDTHMVLNMFYKLNSSGITMTSTSKAGSYAVFPSTVSGSTKITDARAEKVGYDVNAQGDYKWTLAGYNGVGIASVAVTLIGTVKLVDLYANSALIKQSYAVYK